MIRVGVIHNVGTVFRIHGQGDRTEHLKEIPKGRQDKSYAKTNTSKDNAVGDNELEQG